MNQSGRRPCLTFGNNRSTDARSMTTLIADRESKETHHNSTYTVTARTSPVTRDQAVQTVPYVDYRVEQADRAAQALAVSVRYLAFEVRGFFFIFYHCLPPNVQERDLIGTTCFLAGCLCHSQTEEGFREVESRLRGDEERAVGPAFGNRCFAREMHQHGGETRGGKGGPP